MLGGSLAGSRGVSARSVQNGVFGDVRGSTPAPPIPVVPGQTYQVPGPAAGYVRALVQHGIIIPSAPGAVGVSATCRIMPADFYTLRSAFAFTQAQAVGSSANALAFSTGIIVLGEGEYLEVAVTGTGTGSIVYSYIDLPVTGPGYTISLVRASLTDTPAEIIPAAPTGFVNRILHPTTTTAGTYAMGLRPAVCAINSDTAAAQIDTYFGAELTYRSGSTNAEIAFTVGMNPDTDITDRALRMATRVAPTTRSPFVALAYKTIRL